MTEEHETEELTPEELEKRKIQEHQAYLATILEQLTQSERFVRFFNVNYDVHTFFDEKEKTFTVRVVELPPNLAATRLQEMAASHAQEHIPMIQQASLGDIEKVTKEPKNGS